MKLYPHLKENIEALKSHGYAVYEWLSSHNLDVDGLKENVFSNSWDLLDWKLESGEGLFEKMPPNMFYRDWIPTEKADRSATVIIGSNIGYGINHVLRETPDTHKVIVLEPTPEVLVACLGQTDYRPFFEAKKLHFCPPDPKYVDEVIQNLDLQYVFGKINLRDDLPSRQIGPQYAQWFQAFKAKLENYAVEMYTLRKKQDVMVSNELSNFEQAFQNGSLSRLEDTARGVAAVVLGAGPSLAEFAPKLAEQPGYALYTTALQTLPAIREYGLKPHFCMAIDFNEGMKVVYDRLDMEWAEDIPLIYSTKMNPEVVEQYPGPKIPLWTNGGLGTYAMENHEYVMDAGGNVGLTLVRFLRRLAVSHILLVGQDFGWKEGETTHAKGHHAEASRYKGIQVQNLHGENIRTSMQMLASKRDLEQDLRDIPFPVFSLYGGGVPIEGAKPMNWEHVQKNGLLASVPGARDFFMDALRRANMPVMRPSFDARAREWAASLRNVERRLTKLFKKPEKNQEEIYRTIDQAFFFIKQDQLYLPYLFNEIMDMAGLARVRSKYGRKDLSEFKRIAKRVAAKVREMDRILAPATDKKSSGKMAA